MSINRSEMVERISEQALLSRSQAAAALAAFESVVTAEVKSGGEVKLSGFLTIDVVERAERSGRNPRTGEPIVIAATKAPRVTVGRALKEAAKA